MIKEFFKTILYQPLFNILVFLAWLVPGHSIGWGIIGLTALVRVALWVPSMKALTAPLKMRQHQDEIKAIQEKYKDDRTAQAQALTAFYKQQGINPLSGCLPLLIQLPILFILYRVFFDGLRGQRLDLLYAFTPHPEALNTIFFGVNLAEADRLVLPLLAASSQLLQSWYTMKLNPQPTSKDDPTAMMNKQMIFIFPIMTYFIASRLPSGLALYWIATSAFSLLQQLTVQRRFAQKPTATVTIRQKKK